MLGTLLLLAGLLPGCAPTTETAVERREALDAAANSSDGPGTAAVAADPPAARPGPTPIFRPAHPANAAAVARSDVQRPVRPGLRGGGSGPGPELVIPVRAATDDGADGPDQLPVLLGALAKALADDGAKFGVVVEHVPTGERFVHQPHRQFPAGSVYKVALAHEVLRRVDDGRLSLGDVVRVDADDAREPEPDGGLAPGDEVTVRQALRAAMSISSNAAAHALLRRIDRGRFNASLVSLGLADTRVPETIDDGADEEAVTTAADMAEVLSWITRGASLGPESGRLMRDLLALDGEPDGLVAGTPAGIDVLSKAGNLERASNAAGIIMTPGGPVVVSVLDGDVDPGDARLTIKAIVRAVLDAYGR